nr:hypothetical protein [Tanacetum cinerariifolium]
MWPFLILESGGVRSLEVPNEKEKERTIIWLCLIASVPLSGDAVDKDYTMEKANDAKDAKMGRIGEYKDYATQRAYGTLDYN